MSLLCLQCFFFILACLHALDCGYHPVDISHSDWTILAWGSIIDVVCHITSELSRGLSLNFLDSFKEKQSQTFYKVSLIPSFSGLSLQSFLSFLESIITHTQQNFIRKQQTRLKFSCCKHIFFVNFEILCPTSSLNICQASAMNIICCIILVHVNLNFILVLQGRAFTEHKEAL